MIPGPPREGDVGSPGLLSRWLALLRSGVLMALAERPRAVVWRTPAVLGPSGVSYLDADAVPFAVGGVVLTSVEPVDGPLALTAAPVVSAQPLSDGRTRLEWQFLPAGRYRLVLLLVEGVK